MTEEIARTILLVITTVAGLFWLVTTSWFLSLVRSANAEPTHELDDLPRESARPRDRRGIAGIQEVKGAPEQLAESLARDLGRHGLNGVPVRILEADRTRVRFEVMGNPSLSRRPGMATGKPRRGEVEFRRGKGGASLAEYWMEAGASRGLLVAGGVFSALGLAALVLGFWAISTYVVPSPKLAVRGQVVQMVQCIHFLWPPWLFGLLYKSINGALRRTLETRIANLPFV
ncbi:MAG: hypothetical protein AB7I30_00510 [Isosphaeraceae bacterium]